MMINQLCTEPLEWTIVSEPGAVIFVKTAPIPPKIKAAIARALELGKAATNTFVPLEKTPKAN
jgi:hypothetical protein